MNSIFGDYVRALIAEIERTANHPDGPCVLDSVYFGGGTPTTLSARQLADVFDAIRRCIGFASDCEITIEANPGTVDSAKLSALREIGFNRLSLGVQSFDDEFLQSIGRAHTRAQAISAYESARSAGFENIGVDLIFALPGQSIKHWEKTLDTALELRPEHISLYELSIEEGTRFANLCSEGKIAPIDEDVRVDMYELAIAKLLNGGYEHYEVSNFARPGFRSRHNAIYWHNQPYFGFGAGATSYVGGVRARRVAGVRDYIAAVNSNSNLIEFSESLSARARLGETIVLGLRMLDGVDIARVKAETGFDPLFEYSNQIERLTNRKLIKFTDGRLRVTHKGLLLLNDVSAEFV